MQYGKKTKQKNNNKIYTPIFASGQAPESVRLQPQQIFTCSQKQRLENRLVHMKNTTDLLKNTQKAG